MLGCVSEIRRQCQFPRVSKYILNSGIGAGFSGSRLSVAVGGIAVGVGGTAVLVGVGAIAVSVGVGVTAMLVGVGARHGPV